MKRDIKKDLEWMKTRELKWRERVDSEKQETTMSIKDRDNILADKDRLYDIAEYAIEAIMKADTSKMAKDIAQLKAEIIKHKRAIEVLCDVPEACWYEGKVLDMPCIKDRRLRCKKCVRSEFLPEKARRARV